MKQSILVADDHPLFREALNYIIKSVLPDYEVKEATNYAETRSLLKQQEFKLVFVDLNMPDSNGLTDLALIKKLYPQTPIIVVSGHEEPSVIQTCLELNASAYIIKSSSPDEIKKAINMVLDGDIYTPPGVAHRIIKERSDNNSATKKISSLTPSQLTVLIEISKGKLNKQIAYDLDISEATVKAHITTIFKKLEINNRTQAVLFTKEQETLTPNLQM